MSKIFFGLLIAGMLATGVGYAMDSDSESDASSAESSSSEWESVSSDSESSSCESESLPAKDVMTDDILVYIANPDVVCFIQEVSEAQGIDAWQRREVKMQSTLEEDAAFLRKRKSAIRLYKILDSVEGKLSVKRTVVATSSERGMCIRFKTTEKHSAGALEKALYKSPYVTGVECNDVDVAIARERENEPVLEALPSDNPILPTEPCMDPVAHDAVSSDFLVYIGAPQAARYIEKMIRGPLVFNASGIKRMACAHGLITNNEKWLSGMSLAMKLVHVIAKVAKRFNADYFIVLMPEEEKGLYLRFQCESPCNVHEVADILKKSPYVTKIVPNYGDAYLKNACEKLASDSSESHKSAQLLASIITRQRIPGDVNPVEACIQQ